MAHVFPKYITTEKEVGETPLQALEKARLLHQIPEEIPMAYAGRLDPMASGKLLILIGDECRVQEKYHAFDKEYIVELLIGVSSDTGDVLGLISAGTQNSVMPSGIKQSFKSLVGSIELPYPHFSSRTVQGKPLHIWTLENRLHEITIPTKISRIHKLTFIDLREITERDMLKTVREKIETIPTVTDPKKALGADFRRNAVRNSWNNVESDEKAVYQILRFSCIASSGTYMRSLGEKIAHSLGTCGLAYSIHRTKIGTYTPLFRSVGFWSRQF